MKKLTLILLFICSGLFSQQVRFLVIPNPEIGDSKSTSRIDSIISYANTRAEINFVVFSGELTQSGKSTQFDLLQNSLSKLNKTYQLLPGKGDFRTSKGYFNYKENYDDKFFFELNNNYFAGISPIIPFSNITHIKIETLDWLTGVFEKSNLNNNTIYFSPYVVGENSFNWQALFSTLSRNNLSLIINTNSTKTELRNFRGYNVFDISNIQDHKNSKPSFVEFFVSLDSIKIFDSNQKLIGQIDNKVFINKDKIVTREFNSTNAEVLLKTDLNSTTLTSVDYWNKKIYASDESGLVTCIDTTGKILWEYDTFGSIYGKPVIADRLIAIATIQGDISTLSAISGEQIQSIGFEENITTDLNVIQYKGDIELMIAKIGNSESALVFGMGDGSISCYDLETLQNYWTNNSAKEMICTQNVSAPNKVLFTSRDGYLYCIDSRTGLLIWRWKEKADTDLSYSPILVNDNAIFVVASDGVLFSIDLLLGKMNWKIENQNLLAAINLSPNGKSLFAKSKNNKFLLINSARGRIEKEIKRDVIFNESISQPVELDSKIFFENNGELFSLDEKFSETKIMETGDAPLHNILALAPNKYLISNIDGRIIIFRTR